MTEQSIDPEKNPEGFTLKQKCEELKQKLLEKHPMMPNLLADIHRTLRQYPENVTLLDESEINVIVEGLKIQTQTTFAESVTKPKASTVTPLLNKIKKLGAGAF